MRRGTGIFNGAPTVTGTFGPKYKSFAHQGG
jgi:hypothetical protein